MNMSSHPVQTLELCFEGPFGWPGVDNDCSLTPLDRDPCASRSGIYLWSLEYLNKYLVNAAGYTQRPFIRRFREHTAAYREGFFTIFDMDAMKKGQRVEIWHGFFSRPKAPARLQDFNQRREQIRSATEIQLASYRIFIASLDAEQRLLKRIEAAIMNALYLSDGPTSTIPDRGMSLSPRWPTESPIRVRIIGAERFHAVPEEIEV